MSVVMGVENRLVLGKNPLQKSRRVVVFVVPHQALGGHDLLVELKTVLGIGAVPSLLVLDADAALAGHVAEGLQLGERALVHLRSRSAGLLSTVDAVPEVFESDRHFT